MNLAARDFATVLAELAVRPSAARQIRYLVSPGRYPEFLSLLTQAHGIAFKITGNDADAQDAVMRAIVRVFTTPEEPTCLRAYFLQAVRNEARQIVRDRRRAANYAPLIAREHQISDSDDDIIADVRSAVAKLPLIYREAVDLFYMQNYARDEIAELLDITVAALDSRLHTGRKLLKSALNDYQNIGTKERKKNLSLL